MHEDALLFAWWPDVKDALDVAVRCAVVYAILLVALRVAGKRHTGQLSPHDLVVMLLIANALQSAMVGASTSVAGGVAGALTLLVINVVMSRFILHHPRFGPWIAGAPAILVHNGVVLANNLRRERILPDELAAQLRAHGFAGVHEVRIAVAENDGSVSAIGYDGRVVERFSLSLAA